MAAALAMLESSLGFLAGLDKAGMPCEALGGLLQALERPPSVLDQQPRQLSGGRLVTGVGPATQPVQVAATGQHVR